MQPICALLILHCEHNWQKYIIEITEIYDGFFNYFQRWPKSERASVHSNIPFF